VGSPETSQLAEVAQPVSPPAELPAPEMPNDPMNQLPQQALQEIARKNTTELEAIRLYVSKNIYICFLYIYILYI